LSPACNGFFVTVDPEFVGDLFERFFWTQGFQLWIAAGVGSMVFVVAGALRFV
jgi:hypothetical protein